MGAMRILYITPYVPSVISVRPYNLIKGLAGQGHAITLLTLVPPGEADNLPIIRPYCSRVEDVSFAWYDALATVGYALATGLPLQAAYGHSQRLMGILTKTLDTQSFDIVHVEHLRASVLGTFVHGLPKVYDAVDCISLLLERTLAANPQAKSRLMAWLDLERTRRYEGHLSGQYTHTVLTTREDQEALQALTVRYGRAAESERISVLPNGVDLQYFGPQNLAREEETLVFSGKMSYHANIATALYLVQEIMPLIWKERRLVKLWIVGQAPSKAVRALATDERITVTGYVPDLRPYLTRATLAISPVRYGVGIQNKVLEALACGTPVVTSPRACQTLQTRPGEDMMVGDSPAAFAEQVLRLLADSALRQQLGANGRRYVETHHHWTTVTETLQSIYVRARDQRDCRSPT
jgi:polysaccharide biosynthesis protein PslH